jgi:hypothetical protein
MHFWCVSCDHYEYLTRSVTGIGHLQEGGMISLLIQQSILYHRNGAGPEINGGGPGVYRLRRG